MSEKLSPGYQVKTALGSSVRVIAHLGEGGQGDVYKVEYNGQEMALKWYKPGGMGKKPQAFYDNVKQNVTKGAPSEEFLWPQDITEWQDGSFGYVMGLRPEGYYEISEYMLLHVRFASYRTVIDACLHIVSAFRQLHNKGLSYQDLNDGNFFIDPKKGKVLICDNDNVAPNGTETGILGKPRYMAPEIVKGEKKPDNLSDRFSMSVILFILFCLNHPLEGKRSLVPSLTPQLQEKLYGSEAMFMMDPDHTENAPDPKIHHNALMVFPCLPDYMQDMFQRAFSQKALTTPNARPTEKDWLKALARFRSEIVMCSCGNEVFTQQGESCICDRCKRNMRIPFKLVFGEYSVPAVADTRIYRLQVGTCDADEALNPVGRIAVDTESGKLRIKNLSQQIWRAATPSGKPMKVAPGELIPLKDGITFTIDEETIQIRENV